MTRREAIAALVALPPTTRVLRADVTPSDVIVVESQQHLTGDVVARIIAQLEVIWPTNHVCVLDGGMTLKIVNGTRGVS